MVSSSLKNPCHWVLNCWRHLKAVEMTLMSPLCQYIIQLQLTSNTSVYRPVVRLSYLTPAFPHPFGLLHRKSPLTFWGAESGYMYNAPFFSRIIMFIWTLKKIKTIFGEPLLWKVWNIPCCRKLIHLVFVGKTILPL